MMPEQILILFAIVLCGVLIVNVLSRILGNVKELQAPKREHCKLHTWYQVIDENDKDLGLVCIVCSQVPRLEE